MALTHLIVGSDVMPERAEAEKLASTYDRGLMKEEVLLSHPTFISPTRCCCGGCCGGCCCWEHLRHRGASLRHNSVASHVRCLAVATASRVPFISIHEHALSDFPLYGRTRSWPHCTGLFMPLCWYTDVYRWYYDLSQGWRVHSNKYDSLTLSVPTC